MSDEDLARRIAKILGGSSAASKALAQLDNARADGLKGEIFQIKHDWIVRTWKEIQPIPSEPAKPS